MLMLLLLLMMMMGEVVGGGPGILGLKSRLCVGSGAEVDVRSRPPRRSVEAVWWDKRGGPFGGLGVARGRGAPGGGQGPGRFTRLSGGMGMSACWLLEVLGGFVIVCDRRRIHGRGGGGGSSGGGRISGTAKAEGILYKAGAEWGRVRRDTLG